MLACAIRSLDTSTVRELISAGAKVAPGRHQYESSALSMLVGVTDTGPDALSSQSRCGVYFMHNSVPKIVSDLRAGASPANLSATHGAADDQRIYQGDPPATRRDALLRVFGQTLTSCAESAPCVRWIDQIIGTGASASTPLRDVTDLFAENALSVLKELSAAADFGVAHASLRLPIRTVRDMPNITVASAFAASGFMSVVKELAGLAVASSSDDASGLLGSLEAPDGAGRTAFHKVAADFGTEGETFQQLVEVVQRLRAAAGFSRAAATPSAQVGLVNDSIGAYLATLPADMWGNPLSEYARSTMPWKQPTPTKLKKVGGSERAYERGGWASSSWGSAAFEASPPDRCDIQQVPAHMSTSADFNVMPYLHMHRPVILRGAGRYLKARTSCQKGALRAAFGNESLTVATIPYAGMFGVDDVNVTTIADFAEMVDGISTAEPAAAGRAQLYAFDTHLTDPDRLETQEAHAHLLKHFDLTLPHFDRALESLVASWYSTGRSLEQTREALARADVSLEVDGPRIEFYFGPPGSGAPWHYHDPAFNALAYGRKRWFVMPPSRAVFSNKPSVEWYRTEFEQLEPDSGARRDVLECTQEAGDILFVPDRWSHATINLETSIGLAYEMTGLKAGGI